MPTISPIARRAVSCLIVGGSTALFAASASASYTVIDDDLYPTKVVAARNATPQLPPEVEHYSIPFVKDHSPLIYAGRQQLDNLIPRLQGATIRIVGRPDAMPSNDPKIAAVPRNRAINIRDYLTRHGIPANSITIAADNTPNPQQTGNTYPCDIYITRPTLDQPGANPQTIQSVGRPYADPYAQGYNQPQQQAAQYPNQQYSNAPSYSPQQQYTTGAPTRSASISPATAAAHQVSNPAQDQLIQYINQGVQSGRMDPAVAIKLLQTLMASDPSNASFNTTQQVQTPAAPPAPAPMFVATPALVRKETWKLDKALTLRDNIDAWSKQAGWNPSSWEAANYYEVTRSTTLEGGFPDVLRQIADNTGLNICARKREKYVRVTEASVDCTKN